MRGRSSLRSQLFATAWCATQHGTGSSGWRKGGAGQRPADEGATSCIQGDRPEDRDLKAELPLRGTCADADRGQIARAAWAGGVASDGTSLFVTTGNTLGAATSTSCSAQLTISKKVENHVHALSIYFMHYNFVRIHQTLRCTPAMEAGVTDRLWSIDDMAALVEAREESASEVTRKGWTKRKAASAD